MMDFIFGTTAGWITTGVLIAAGCAVAGYFIPRLRLFLLGVAAIALSAASIYAKGNRDRAALERKRKDQAVKKARKEYDEIDNRRDTSADVIDRLRRGGF